MIGLGSERIWDPTGIIECADSDKTMDIERLPIHIIELYFFARHIILAMQY